MKKPDIILIAGILLIGVALFAGYRIWYRTPGDMVAITIDGELYQTLSLAADTTVELPSAGGGSNTLTIRNHCADITEADCPDKLCVKQKTIRHAGETLVCLPHKVIVKVIGADEERNEDTLDGVAY